MYNALILGAGLVTRPLVKYMLSNDIKITLADIDKNKALALIDNHINAEAIQLDVENDELLNSLIEKHDIVVSLLPYIFHVKIAKICIAKKTNMVTASYVSADMKDLDKEATENNIIILNEIGLDPGIDHMSAMKIIDEVKLNGGYIRSFESCCGGLPAPDANDNPLGYKFSWSPKGVVMAGKNPAKYLKDKIVIDIEGKYLFKNNWLKDVETLGSLEVYPNRDSIIYKELYGLENADTVFRGTFRYPGWCKTLFILSNLGYLDDEIRTDLKEKTYLDLVSELLGTRQNEDAVEKFLNKYDLNKSSSEFINISWLGLFDNKPIAKDKKTLLDLLADLMLSKMIYKKGERDIVVLQHDFIAEFPDKKEKITSLLIDYGVPNGDSSMARTVSLPTAIAAKLILENKIDLKGVQIPVAKEIYLPVLKELENLGIELKESYEEF